MMPMAQGTFSISKNQPGGEPARGEPTWYRKLRDSSWSSSWFSWSIKLKGVTYYNISYMPENKGGRYMEVNTS